jgi:hypothetical protein
MGQLSILNVYEGDVEITYDTKRRKRSAPSELSATCCAEDMRC